MRRKYYLILVPIVVIIGIIYLMSSARNQITFEFKSNRKFSYAREDYDEQNYVIFDTFGYLHNDLDHTIIESFYQDVQQNNEAVYNHVFYNRANTRTIQNVHFDGDQVLVNEYEVSYVGDIRDERKYSCSNQIVSEESDETIRYQLVDCNLDYSTKELEEWEDPNVVSMCQYFLDVVFTTVS